MSPAAPELLAGLREILGADGILTADADCARYLSDHRRLYQGRARAVLRPRTVAEVVRLLALCNAQRVGVVPQGGNTSYCGGATPDESGQQVVLSLERLNRIRSVDAANYSLIAEAGCVLAQVQRAAADAQRFFPLSLGSEGSCQIGGNLSTNAGGTAVLRYGMMRELVLGLEVVLADGRVLESLSALRKDNTGYDIKSLFLGAEGTLGVITAASLKLFAAPRAHATALVAIPDVQAAVTLLGQLREVSGDAVSSFELMPRVAIELAVRHLEGVSDPLARPYPWYVLCELSAARAAALGGVLEEALAAALGAGTVLDAALARSERERAALWHLREHIPEAQRREGAGLQARHLRAGGGAAAVRGARRRVAGRPRPGRTAGGLRPRRRRQPAFQRQCAAGRRAHRVPGARRGRAPRHPRPGARIRRQRQRRARHRAPQGRRAGTLRRATRTGADARGEACL